MMKIIRSLLFFSGVLFLSCATTNLHSRVDNAVYRDDYPEGIALIEKDKKSLYRDKDILLYYLDGALLNHYALRYEESSQLFQAGERAIEDAYTKSVIMEIGTYILNDTTREYGGEDYEDIYINVFNALNYYHMGNIEDAMVEIRRMNNKLQFLASKYGVITSKLQQKALEDEVALPPGPGGEVHFFNSALARYLGMLFYRGTGHTDDARIDRDQLKLAFANAPSVYTYPPPASIDDELAIPPGKARLNVIAFSGLGPVKTEEVIRIPVSRDRYVKIALPVMVQRPSQVSRVEVFLDTGEQFSLELLEDIGAAARETFKERADLIYLKSVIRAVIKTASSSILDSASDEAGGNAGLALGILSIGVQLFAEASEQADLRISRYFPARAYAGGINLDPGVYSFTVNYYTAAGRLAASFNQENIVIAENQLNLAEAVCLK
jgi:hypothetical protein